jgi:hypothetical protein
MYKNQSPSDNSYKESDELIVAGDYIIVATAILRPRKQMPAARTLRLLSYGVQEEGGDNITRS